MDNVYQAKLKRVRKWNALLLTTVLGKDGETAAVSPSSQYQAQLAIRTTLRVARQLKTVAYQDAEPNTEERRHTKELLGISLLRFKEAVDYNMDFISAWKVLYATVGRLDAEQAYDLSFLTEFEIPMILSDSIFEVTRR